MARSYEAASADRRARMSTDVRSATTAFERADRLAVHLRRWARSLYANAVFQPIVIAESLAMVGPSDRRASPFLPR